MAIRNNEVNDSKQLTERFYSSLISLSTELVKDVLTIGLKIDFLLRDSLSLSFSVSLYTRYFSSYLHGHAIKIRLYSVRRHNQIDFSITCALNIKFSYKSIVNNGSKIFRFI